MEASTTENYVTLDNFSRYQIYPSGRVFDIVANKNVVFNRRLNFAMYPDIPMTDEEIIKNNGYNFHLENLRDLIKFLVDSKVEGFENELPPYEPPNFFLPLSQGPLMNDESKFNIKPKALYFLRKAQSEAGQAIIDAAVKGEDTKPLADAFETAQANLEQFKQQYPLYYRWPPYVEPVTPEYIEKITSELKEVQEKLIPLTKRQSELVIHITKWTSHYIAYLPLY